jgi:hypothetical protein
MRQLSGRVFNSHSRQTNGLNKRRKVLVAQRGLKRSGSLDVIQGWNGDGSRKREPASGCDLIFGLEIQLDIHVVGVADENLPTAATGHLVHAKRYALA